MQIELINQGLSLDSEKSLGSRIHSILSTQRIKKITIVTAFTSSALAKKFLRLVNTSKTDVRFITGVDQRGTSKEALLELMNRHDITSRIYYSSTLNIFHPKIYLLESDDKFFLFIGSQNFTQTGFFNNIEASMLVVIDNTDVEIELIEQLRKDFPFIDKDNVDCLYKVDQNIINQLDQAGLLPSIEEIKEQFVKSFNVKRGSRTVFKKSKVAPIPSFYSKISDELENAEMTNAGTFITTNNNIAIAAERAAYEAVPVQKRFKKKVLWVSSPLTERDLNIPSGSNTNITGDINLDRGAMPSSIDFRHHYRDIVFGNLAWKNSQRKGSTHLEEVYTQFTIFIDKKEVGVYNLKLSHNPLTTTTSYRQRNAMTKLKWGEARNVIANKLNLNKTMTIIESENENGYIIQIE